ncbi:MAG: hypothetical protein F6J90_06760 [Moorea sp. SIOASIH]|uniref:hypothetical protein n=1 Tax=Moorena sp. SIOASIH TaxID=2607817 RepID=UPI0013BA5034|nr:hypothetical protein [Moorena sp. SIOASIH]NEO36039.1 hypothetical protein [Moorena sp. SIOASIH]
MTKTEGVGKLKSRNHVYSVSHSNQIHNICSLLPTPYSLLPTPYSLLPIPYSLLPTPYSLLP